MIWNTESNTKELLLHDKHDLEDELIPIINRQSLTVAANKATELPTVSTTYGSRKDKKQKRCCCFFKS